MNHDITNEDQEMLRDFVADSLEVMDQVEQMIFQFEKNSIPEETQPLVGGMFRLFHSLKGTAGFLALTAIQDFTHKVEDVLQNLREDSSLLGSHHVDLFFSCCDLLRNMLIQVENEFHDRGFEQETTTLVTTLSQYLAEPFPLPQPPSPSCNVSSSMGLPTPSVKQNVPILELTKLGGGQNKLLKILYIDDSEELQNIVQDYFEEMHQIQVRGATDQIMGIQLAELEKPDLILLDTMKTNDGQDAGIEMLKQFKNDPLLQHIPVIMCMAQIDHETALKAMEWGVEDFERKPFDLEWLAEKVKCCFARLSEKNKKIEEKQTSMTKLITRMKKAQLESQQQFQRAFFLEIMMSFFNNSFRCKNATDLLNLLIATTQTFNWHCTVALIHHDTEIYRSDHKEHEIGGFIIRELRKENKKVVQEDAYLFVMTANKKFSLLIRNKDILNPSSESRTKLRRTELCRCAEELVQAFMARYQVFLENPCLT